MSGWDDMTQQEQDDLYPVWLAVFWCVCVFCSVAVVLASLVVLAIMRGVL